MALPFWFCCSSSVHRARLDLCSCHHCSVTENSPTCLLQPDVGVGARAADAYSCSTVLGRIPISACTERCYSNTWLCLSLISGTVHFPCARDQNQPLVLDLLVFPLIPQPGSVAKTCLAMNYPGLALYVSSAEFCCHLRLGNELCCSMIKLLSFSNHSDQDR